MKKSSIWIIIIILTMIGVKIFSPQIDSVTHVEVEKVKLYSNFRNIDLIDDIVQAIDSQLNLPVTYVEYEEDADIVLNYGSRFDFNKFTSVKVGSDNVKLVTNKSIDLTMSLEQIISNINRPQDLTSERKIILSPMVLEFLESRNLINKESSVVSDNLNEIISTDYDMVGLLFENEIVSNEITDNEINTEGNQEISLSEDINLLINKDSKYFNEISSALVKLQLKGEKDNE